MARTVKPREEADLDGFFAGVAEMRAHLDRHLQDPERRRARLSKIAAELLKPRAVRELVEWLTQELARAVGALYAVVWVKEHKSFGVWAAVGTPERATYDTILRLVERLPASSEVQAVQSDAGLLVPLSGIDRVVGALWLEASHPIDEASRVLLQAIADTVGVSIEQALTLASLAAPSVDTER